MAPRGPRPLLFLTLVLLAVGLAHILKEPKRYKKFVRDHVDFPKTKPLLGRSYCNYMMRRVNQNRGVCKTKHTFIHRSANELQAVCRNPERCNKYKQCTSKAAIPVTTCQARHLSRPPCVYRGISQTRRIRLGCEQRRPVSFVSVL